MANHTGSEGFLRIGSAITLSSASCTGTTLTTSGSPSLIAGMTVWAANGTSLGVIVSGSVNTWTVSIGGTYTSQTMLAGYQLAELRSWTITETADTMEDTTMGDSWRTYQSVLKAWTGSAVCYWDETDTGAQMALTAGASITLTVYPEGISSSAPADTYYSGSAIVTSIERTAAFDGMVESTFNFQGSGALTKTN
jgi:hypothetical protein